MQVALKDAKRGDMVIVRDTVQATGMPRVTVNFLTSVLKSKKIVKTLWGIHYDISTGKAVGYDKGQGQGSRVPNGKILAVIRQDKVLFEGYPTTVNILRLNDSKGTFDVVQGTLTSAFPVPDQNSPKKLFGYDLLVGDNYFHYLPRQGTSVWASFSDSVTCVTYVIQELITFPKSNKRKR